MHASVQQLHSFSSCVAACPEATKKYLGVFPCLCVLDDLSRRASQSLLRSPAVLPCKSSSKSACLPSFLPPGPPPRCCSRSFLLSCVLSVRLRRREIEHQIGEDFRNWNHPPVPFCGRRNCSHCSGRGQGGGSIHAHGFGMTSWGGLNAGGGGGGGFLGLFASRRPSLKLVAAHPTAVQEAQSIPVVLFDELGTEREQKKEKKDSLAPVGADSTSDRISFRRSALFSVYSCV